MITCRLSCRSAPAHELRAVLLAVEAEAAVEQEGNHGLKCLAGLVKNCLWGLVLSKIATDRRGSNTVGHMSQTAG